MLTDILHSLVEQYCHKPFTLFDNELALLQVFSFTQYCTHPKGNTLLICNLNCNFQAPISYFRTPWVTRVNWLWSDQKFTLTFLCIWTLNQLVYSANLSKRERSKPSQVSSLPFGGRGFKGEFKTCTKTVKTTC